MRKKAEKGKIIKLHNGQSINPQREPLTVEKLKTFKGNEHLTDEEARDKVFTIQALSSLLFEYYKCLNKNVYNNDNQYIIIDNKLKSA